MASSTYTASASECVQTSKLARKKTGEGFRSLILMAMWWGIFAGMFEGAGLLIFQRIDWERWGPMVHVSRDIIWISPVVDTLLFACVALLVGTLKRLADRIAASTILVFLLSFLTTFDWLALTERLTPRSCVLLAAGIAVALNRWFSRNRKPIMRFWQKSVPWMVSIWLVIFVGMRATEWLWERRQLANLPTARPGAPNVLLIIVDTLRADHLSGYGYSRSTTPNLDRISSQGVLFENAISASSWTLPSHASLMTGRYPVDHGWQNVQQMPWLGWGNKALRGLPTLGEALEREGYRTGAFSANQLYFTSSVGFGRGFVHFEDYFPSLEDMALRTEYGRKFDHAYLHRTQKSKITRGLRWLGLTKLLDDRKRAGEVNREAVAWMSAGRQPFLAVLNYIDVHDAGSLPWAKRRPAWGLATKVDRYDSALTYVDREVGDLFDQLNRRGLDKNTAIIVTGDHGEGLGDHDTQFHGITLYREAIHVPLFVLYPGHVPAGVRVARPVSNAAIAETIMDVVGSGNQAVFPGPGLDSLWTGAFNAEWPDPISELQKNGIDDRDSQARDVEPTAIDGDMQSLVTPEWHLIRHQTLADQLYNWERDPAEVNNLINTRRGQAIAAGLATELQRRTAP